MMYRLYCSSGNTVGIDEYISYSEIGPDGYWLRYVEIKAGAGILRYSHDHAADAHGVLPEGKWDEDEASKSEYGIVAAISGELFETVWAATRGMNEIP
jgi:hypothetical protein